MRMSTTKRKKTTVSPKKRMGNSLVKRTSTANARTSTAKKSRTSSGTTTKKAHKQVSKKPDTSLNRLFLDELDDVYSSENQLVSALPRLHKLASSQELKDALKKHLGETRQQVKRIIKIFKLLGRKMHPNPCEAMEGLIKEADELVHFKNKSSVRDAAIISAAQKIEHYEIASYGVLRSFAKHLSLEKEIVNLLQESLDEEGAADKHLSKIAEGGLFFGGVNQEAANE